MCSSFALFFKIHGKFDGCGSPVSARKFCFPDGLGRQGKRAPGCFPLFFFFLCLSRIWIGSGKCVWTLIRGGCLLGLEYFLYVSRDLLDRRYRSTKFYGSEVTEVWEISCASEVEGRHWLTIEMRIDSPWYVIHSILCWELQYQISYHSNIVPLHFRLVQILAPRSSSDVPYTEHGRAGSALLHRLRAPSLPSIFIRGLDRNSLLFALAKSGRCTRPLLASRQVYNSSGPSQL